MTALPAESTVQHGTLTCYARGCRHPDCRRAAWRHNKELRVRVLRGEPRLIDAARMREHVEQLLAAGMSFRAISLAAGWKSRNALDEALKRNRVLPRTFNRVMAVTPDSDQRPTTYIDATGARRRLQALAAIGWDSRTLAARLRQKHPTTVQHVRSGRQPRLRRSTAAKIAALFDELWDQPGPSDRARLDAAQRRWAPPMAWDDESIDDPAVRPHGVHRAVDR
jgi:hypothetical protein